MHRAGGPCGVGHHAQIDVMSTLTMVVPVAASERHCQSSFFVKILV